MGNCFAFYDPKRIVCAKLATVRHVKVVRIVKSDYKILKYKRPMLVRDILMDFSGYGIGLSKKPLCVLPTNYELKIRHVYYLVRPVNPAYNSPYSVDMDSTNGIKRIKVIITKQQFQELLSKNILVEEMLLAVQNAAWNGVNSSARWWRPVLEPIPEGSEYHLVM